MNTTIFNFAPLLIWMLLFPLVASIGDRILKHERTQRGAEAVAFLWICGGVLWFLIGAILSIFK